MRTVSFYMKFSELIDMKSLMDFENSLRVGFAVEKINILCFYPSEKFTLDYFSVLRDKLKRKISAVNGFLDDCNVSLEDGVINVELKNGGWHNLCLTTPFSQPSLRHSLYLDFTLARTNMRVGYMGDLQQSSVNRLKSHTYSHAFMVGFTKNFIISKKPIQ